MDSFMGLGSYDGSRPEPPYQTDSDAVADLQGQIDALEAALSSTQSQLSQAREELERGRWISVDEALPNDGETVGFVTHCPGDKWYHGRILGGRFMAGEFGGFSVPGLMVQASHWFRFPEFPESIRAALTPTTNKEAAPSTPGAGREGGA